MKKRKLRGKLLTLALALPLLFTGQAAITAYAAGTAEVVAESGNIREKASTDSTALASVQKGDTLEVTASTTDADGYTWYKVYVDSDSQGYVRADVVTVEGTVPEESSSAGNADSSETSGVTVVGSGGNVTTENTDDPDTGEEGSSFETDSSSVVSVRVTTDVRVRSGPGTDYEVAGQAQADTQAAVSGQALDTEGMLWYQVSLTGSSGTEVNGFIREDFLEILEMAAEEEPVAEETEAAEEPVQTNDDYSLSYRENDAGEMEWYLVDHIQGTSVRLTELLNAAAAGQEAEEGVQVSTLKLVIILMAVFLALLVIIVIFLLLKLRDAEWEYEEEEDEEEDEEEEEEKEEEFTVKRPKPRFLRKANASPGEETPSEKRADDAPQEAGKEAKAPAQEAQPWQSRDFLELDDDMEFDFLDL